MRIKSFVLEKRKIRRKFRKQLKSNKTATYRYFSTHCCNKLAAYLRLEREYRSKARKNVASEPLKPQNFVAALPNMRCISQKRNALLRICGETIGAS